MNTRLHEWSETPQMNPFEILIGCIGLVTLPFLVGSLAANTAFYYEVRDSVFIGGLLAADLYSRRRILLAKPLDNPAWHAVLSLWSFGLLMMLGGLACRDEQYPWVGSLVGALTGLAIAELVIRNKSRLFRIAL